jgi:Fe-S-cluster containining protein
MIPVNCKKCGYCCTLAVKLSSDDVDRIKKKGYHEGHFIEKRGHSDILKMVNNYCIFLEIRQGIASCKVYDARPKKCIEYPGTTECSLHRHIMLTKF